MSESIDARASKSGHGDNMINFIGVFDIGHNISENKSSFRICMVNFDCCTIVCLVDIKWLIRLSSSHIFCNTNCDNDICWKFWKAIEVFCYPDHSCSPRHITLHIEHGSIWLDLDSPSIKCHSFPYKCIFFSFLWFFWCKNHHIRRKIASRSYCENEITSEFF